MRNILKQKVLDERRREEAERVRRFQYEQALAEARREKAIQDAPEAAPEPDAPEVPMETTSTTETAQEAGLDGSGAKQSVKTETSRPARG